MFTKPSRVVTRIFIHCTASDHPEHDNVETLYKWHVEENGWSDIGYHFLISKDGSVHKCRNLEANPAAQKGHNLSTIAICLSGLYDFTEEQFNSLKNLCDEINVAYNEQVTFHGHREVADKECPVFDYKSVLNLDKNGNILERNIVMEGKSFLLSKTLWVNAIALIATYFGVEEFANVEFQNEIVVAVMAVTNVVLRFFTKEPVKLV